MKKLILFLLCTIMFVPTIVSAHTSLSSSNPAEGQVVTEALEQITLTYATTIEELSTMNLLKDGNKLSFEEIKIDNKQMIGTISKPLENGSYTIQWNIVGEDGHPIKGEINFVVQMDQSQTETPVAPDEDKGKQDDNSQTTENEPNKIEQETANDTVKITENNDTKSSSSMLVPIAIGLIVIFGIVLLVFTGKKKR
ncbi:copper resistance protein CopC [Neobacillus niacini]|uniref:copper resistance protein CopC n=1 Tax=Neobacillus niacini TaxID=86668 RepID=UPI002FFD9112